MLSDVTEVVVRRQTQTTTRLWGRTTTLRSLPGHRAQPEPRDVVRKTLLIERNEEEEDGARG
jgi:hypothetical protein